AMVGVLPVHGWKLSLMPWTSLAQEAKRESTLMPVVVVTANRDSQWLIDSMHSMAVIDQKELRDQGFRTLPNALSQTPGVSVQETTQGHGSPYIRGFTGRQNLLLVDGVRMNNSTYRSGPVQYWNTVDAFAMERMELVKSHGSVIYGSDALGGTMQVLSRGSGFESQALAHISVGNRFINGAATE
ncbi:MAG: Plug domain-containing protein, partial [Verrucomicrobia bacterium]|nr:Plug domain-containing protein [Verrucomicrobiota bacterium]